MTDRADLSEVATSTLERLREAITCGRLETPITRAVLLGQGVHHQLEALESAFSGHTARACLTVLDAVLAERSAHSAPPPELVWTGPERAHATARDTAVVLRALFESAQRQVILAGYDFTHGESLLEPLWHAMRDRAVDVRFFVHFQQADAQAPDPIAYAEDAVGALISQVWRFGDPRPRVYYDLRALAPYPKFNMHAKCVVVDGERALITSANFTRRAQEHNLECGVLLENAGFAHHLARQWLGLIEAGLVRQWAAR